jgi:NADH-quinone oxidoreductase subunit E
METTVYQEAPAARQFGRVCEILTEHDNNPAMLIPILQAVQAEYRYLPEDVLAYVATALGLSPARTYGVATFYSHFALQPKGEHVVRFCDGTACHVKQSTALIDAVRTHLGLREGQTTTPDLMFTVETVSCLGACGLAPVMTVNEEVHGQMTPATAVAVVKDVQARAAAREEAHA